MKQIVTENKFNQNKTPDWEKVVKDRKVRREVAKNSHLFCFHIYFPHYVKYATASFHHQLFQLTEDESIRAAVIEAFRGSGKTTIIGLSYVIWSIVGRQQKKFVLILAQTQEQARQNLANIKSELETNSLLRSDLGPFEEPDDEWRSVSIVLPKYGARIMIASIDKPVRGLRHKEHRPDLIICDDLEDLDTVRTRESRDKIYNWITGDVLPIGDKDTRFIMIGTRLHDDSVLMRLRRDILEGRMNGVTRSYPLINENGIIAWPDKYKNQEDIQALKKSIPSLQAWEREYLLHIISEDDQVIRKEWIQSYSLLPQDNQSIVFRYAAIGVDPAISQSEAADYTAIVSARVYGRGNNLQIYILPNSINKKMDFPETVRTIKDLYRVSGSSIWIEDIAYQKSLIDQLRADGCPAKEFKTHGSDKRARLSLVSQHVQSGKVLFPMAGADQLISQILGFGTERHDDLVDAFTALVLGILNQESITFKGYYSLIKEQEIEVASVIELPLIGEKRLGVVLAGGSRTYSAIVLRAENAAQVLFHESTDDQIAVATKVIAFAKQHGIIISNKFIFIDKTSTGEQLCELVTKYAKKELIQKPYDRNHYQEYGINPGEKPEEEKEKYADTRTRGFWRLHEWLQSKGKLMRHPIFADLCWVRYAEQSDGKLKIIDKETLREHGIDFAVPEALALTCLTDKERIREPFHQRQYISQYPDIEGSSIPQETDIFKDTGWDMLNEVNNFKPGKKPRFVQKPWVDNY